jgi:DNA helicase II / ATP-dependent DNA helicase PcrA
VSDILSTLNPAQREAAATLHGPLLIIAGAGSGKTRTLTHRIANLIESGVAANKILAVTFTNKAAREMGERIEFLIRGQKGPKPTIGTFHSVSVRILRREAALLGYDSSFVIYDDADQLSLMRTLLKERGIDPKELNPRAVLGAISGAKNELLTPERYAELAQGFFQERVSELYRAYQIALRRAGAMDFDDLIMQTVRLFETEPARLEYYQERFHYIHIDEYQDTNHAQYRWVSLLAAKYRELCVVGDPDQGIYSWRGANISNILEFEKEYPDAKVVSLEQNYRSTATILAAADSVISQNVDRKPKTLWTEGPAGEPLRLYEALDEQDEARFVVGEAEALAGFTGSLRGSAVLYRTNAQSRAVEEMCLRYNVAYRIVGGVRFYERREIKDMLAYLRLIFSGRDPVALRRVSSAPPRGLGDKTLDLIERAHAESETDLFTAMERLTESGELSGRAAQVVSSFSGQLRRWQELARKESPSDLIRRILRDSGLEDHLRDGTPEGEARVENVRELESVATTYSSGEPWADLERFLEEVALIADVDNYSESEEALTLMTVHSAKGLEFDHVFVLGLEEGIFPHGRTQLDPAELEEERRLMYVAITRARKRLYLSYALRRLLYGSIQQNTPSRFIREIGPEHFGDVTGALPTPGPVREVEEHKLDVVFEVGDGVKHDKFGVGRVTDVSGDEIAVIFPQVGAKRLSVTFAPIEKVTSEDW